MKPLYLTLAFLILFWNCADTIAQQSVNEKKWERFLLRSTKIGGEFRYFSSSSELDKVDPNIGGFGKYSVINVLDKDPTTAWVEGVSGYGIGESIIIGINDRLPDIISLRNGYQKSESIYRSNSRPKSIKLSLYLGFFLEGDVTETESVYNAIILNVTTINMIEDSLMVKEIPIEKPLYTEEEYKKKFKELYKDKINEISKWCPECAENPELLYLLKLEILDIHKGTKWDDTCISDIEFLNKKDSNKGIPGDDIIEDVYESVDTGSGVILVDTDKTKNIILVDKTDLPEYKKMEKGESLELVLMDVSPDKEWAQVDYMFYEKGAGRVEEYSVLYHTRSLKRVDQDILKEIYGAYGFVEKNGIIYLDSSTGPINLAKIKKQINSVY